MANGTVVIIGGGVVGLNIALALAENEKASEIYLIEKEKYLGSHTSTRNSEVIHAGFAYEPGSLKARLCVEGNFLTYALLDRLGVRYKKSGKWIVAYTDSEAAALDALLENALVCGVPELRRADIKEVEAASPPARTPIAAAFSATSGIMDGSAYLRALEVKLSNMENVQVIYPCEATKIDIKKGIIGTSRGEMPFDIVINAGGLFADEVYKMSGGKKNFEIRPYKGEYYTWRKGTSDGLIYPVSHRFLCKGDASKVSSMGVHLHRNVAGELYIGPTEIALPVSAKTDYSIGTTAEEISQMVAPLLKKAPDPAELEQGFAGNRPKLFEDGKPKGDFEIFRDGNVIHLLGIESPGLTAAPAIARYVANILSSPRFQARIPAKSTQG